MNFAVAGFRSKASRTAVFVIAVASFATAQITFNNFQNTNNLTLNGNAARSGNVLRLTPALGGQVGSAWFNNLQQVGQGFTTSFTFQFSQPSSPPADGIAFVIQSQGLNALGGGGGSIGYGDIGGPCPEDPESTCDAGGGIKDSVAIEFDTFDNGTATGDPFQNHIAVQVSGVGFTNCPAHIFPNDDNFPNCLLPGSQVVPIDTNMSDGQPHAVVIDYNPNASCVGDSCSLLTVSLDGTQVLSTQLSLGSEMTLNDGSAFVGFTSATGEEFESHDILNWTFTPHTEMTVGPLHTTAGQTTVFNFGAFNFKSTPEDTISRQGDDLTVTAKPIDPGTHVMFGAGKNAICIDYDNTGGSCWEFDVLCSGPDCGGSYDAEFATSYDHAAAIVAPGFLKKHSLTSSCPTAVFDTNQIDGFFQTRIDPTTKAKSGGTGSCWLATQNTDGITDNVFNFIGFLDPVQNAAINVVKGGQAVPLKFQVLNSAGQPLSNLSLCTTGTCPTPSITITFGGPISCTVDTDITDITGDLTSTAGNSGLQNLGNGNYQYVWKTPKITGCYFARVSLNDGVVHDAIFKFK